MAPQREKGVARLVLCAHGRRTPEFIVFSGKGRCSFQVRNRGPIQDPSKGKVTSKLGRSYFDTAVLQDGQLEYPGVQHIEVLET